ncbi:hypothetical protein BJ165DRAFT_14635 [Panaeolus papilionaceus]|nr:hypothetical protein BJ165DRAFT_14635 [Panaeolus papilionaceus]
MVSYASHMDHVDSAFRELTRLSNEFYIIPRSEFPFRCFKHHEIWNEFGISPKESFFDFKRLGSTKGEWKTSPDGTLLIIVLTQGNYLAAHILRGLRTGSVKPIRVRDHNLARLLDLPYDIILEIIGHLHPIDLYSLIRTAKPLRNILLSRRSLSVWALVFANHEDIPPIPRGNSPPRWVTTLFAPPRCDVSARVQTYATIVRLMWKHLSLAVYIRPWSTTLFVNVGVLGVL